MYNVLDNFDQFWHYQRQEDGSGPPENAVRYSKSLCINSLRLLLQIALY